VSLHRNRVVQLARRCSRTQAQPLASMDEPRRFALLVPYLWEQYQECIDQLLDLADAVLGELLRKGERTQDRHIETHAQTMNAQLHVLTAVAEAFLRAEADGLRVRLGVQAAIADRNAAYFDDGWGLTIYLHLADVGPPFRQRVIRTNESEAWYVIDALCNHETEFEIKEHFTDTGGSSEHVFGACLFLGFRFSPRIADMLGQQLWTIGKRKDYGVLNPLLKGRIATRLIIEHWDGVQRMIASIRHGTVPASLLMRKLAAYPRQHQLAVTLAEIGKIERTCHLLECLRSEAKRRTIEVRRR